MSGFWFGCKRQGGPDRLQGGANTGFLRALPGKHGATGKSTGHDCLGREVTVNWWSGAFSEPAQGLGLCAR